MIYECCPRQEIANMDYLKASPINWYNSEIRINRVCLKCWTHWFGSEGEVKMFTKQEWDQWICQSEKTEDIQPELFPI